MSPFRAKWPIWAPIEEVTVIEIVDSSEGIYAVCVLDGGALTTHPVHELRVASRPLDWPVLE